MRHYQLKNLRSVSRKLHLSYILNTPAPSLMLRPFSGKKSEHYIVRKTHKQSQKFAISWPKIFVAVRRNNRGIIVRKSHDRNPKMGSFLGQNLRHCSPKNRRSINLISSNLPSPFTENRTLIRARRNRALARYSAPISRGAEMVPRGF